MDVFTGDVSMHVSHSEFPITQFKKRLVVGYLLVGFIGCLIGLAGLLCMGIYVYKVYYFVSSWIYRLIFISLLFPFATYIVSNGFHLAFEAFSRIFRIKEIVSKISEEG